MPLIQGFQIDTTREGISYVARYVGDPHVPGDVRRRRRSVYDGMRRLGTPVLLKHRFNDEDVENGLAMKSPAFDDVYGQTFAHDQISHGVGYCSVELSDDEWYHTTTGQIVKDLLPNTPGYARAPKYRGYGPGFLAYVVQPDTSLDFFRLTPGGALIRVQSARAIAAWYPDLNDNDLLINVVLDGAGNIVDTEERFELKSTDPITVRGSDRRGRRDPGADGGNRFLLNQSFEMALVPTNHPISGVEVDR